MISFSLDHTRSMKKLTLKKKKKKPEDERERERERERGCFSIKSLYIKTLKMTMKKKKKMEEEEGCDHYTKLHGICVLSIHASTFHWLLF